MMPGPEALPPVRLGWIIVAICRQAGMANACRRVMISVRERSGTALRRARFGRVIAQHDRWASGAVVVDAAVTAAG